MADLAIGISKTTVEALVKKVNSAIKDEAEKLKIVERDIVFIKDEFEMMQSFLDITSVGRMNNRVVTTWIRQSFWQYLSRDYRVRTILPLYQAVEDIGKLKNRAEQVNQRNVRYSLINNSEEQVLRTSAASQRILDFLMKPRDAFDDQNEILNLTELIKTEDKGLQVISVCGTGGDIGTVSIIKEAFNDQKIRKMFEFRAWVKLMHPFNPQDFIRSLLVGFYANSPSDGKGIFSSVVKFAKWLARKETSGEQEPDVGASQKEEADVGAVLATMDATQDSIITNFMDIIKKKPYLIVLEDLSSIVDWNAIRVFMKDMNNGSRIIVSTQQPEIASMCTEPPSHVWLLRKFSSDHSVYAFFRKLPEKRQDINPKPSCLSRRDRNRGLSNPGDDHWKERHDLFGRSSEINKLVEQIATAYARKLSVVISVFGIAGVGKSFLVEAFYNHFTGIFDSHATETSRDGGATSNNWDTNMMNEAGLIIDKCGRLPKLSVALVKYLVSKKNDIREARRLNANFMSALKNIKELDTFRAIFIWMYSNFLASPQLLKKCVFYLSIFTQSSRIRQSRLVRRWIAEGYSEGNDSNSNVEYAEKLIHDLANLGMMEYSQHTPTTMPGEASCQINSFFLEYVISQETEENIFLPLEISVLKGEADQNLRHARQHLVIGSTWRRDEFVFAHLDFSRLRSLTVAREWRSFLISDRMKVLRILDLEDTNVTNEDIEQVVKILPRLKFLGLRRCIKVSDLPDSLGNLRQLQTLDIRHTSVTKLPDSIRKLQEVQYIRAGARVAFVEEQTTSVPRSNYVRWNRRRLDACDGIVVPEIGALKALHTLGVVNVGIRGGIDRLRELKNLNQLNKLAVSGIKRKNFKELVSAIEGNSSLESLTLQLHKDNNFEWLGKIRTPRNLNCLKIYVHIEKYTHWNCLQVLGQIKRLHTLTLRFETDQDVELQFCDRADTNSPSIFSEVKVLEIASRSNLHIKFFGTEMAALEMLKVHCLNGSSLQFYGIEHPRSLKHVLLRGSFDDAVKEELKRKVAQHPKKPLCKVDEPCQP
ncbi:hypothetical protein HU200_012869 [Digitaria exilis]|uniref:Disease resistance protein RPM1 n=1 Tax=Digitaria exilis TaxID=1010633 RepID=A0A835KMV0_9POAL|nr:hypothetical protein HU200_012869 [Digitaria exilis]